MTDPTLAKLEEVLATMLIVTFALFLALCGALLR